MKEFMRAVKIDVIVTSVVCIVMGVVLILFPTQVVTVACQGVGVVLAILGGVRLVSTLFSKVKSGIDFPLGLLLLIVGMWILLHPASIESLIFIGVGVTLFVHGIKGIQMAWESKKNGYNSWLVLMLLSLLNAVFGVVCVIDCFGVFTVTATIALTLVGLALIYDGISSIFILSRVRKAAKEIIEDMEALDVPYEESE